MPPPKPVKNSSGGPAVRRPPNALPTGGYRLEILARRSVSGLGSVIQTQITLDRFPQVMLGITAGPAMLAAPVMIPGGGVHRAQAG